MKKLVISIVSCLLAFGSAVPLSANADFYSDNWYYCMGDSDGNGMVDGKDASKVLTLYSRSSVGNYSMTSTEKFHSDVNRDGIVDGKDASEILSYYSKVSVGMKTFPDNYYMINMLKSGNRNAIISAAGNMFDMTASAAFQYQLGSRFKLNYQDYFIYNNIYYYRVADSRIKTTNDVYTDYYSIFGINDFLGEDSPSGYLTYVDGSNGGCYVPERGRGSVLSYKYSKITAIKSMTTDSVTFNVMSHYDDSDYGGGKYSENKNANFTLQLQNDGTLKVTEFTLPY